MTTGDLKNNLRKFHAELKLISYVSDMDIEGLSIGRPSAFLPILHFVLTEFSIELAQFFYSKEYELLGKNDKNFVSVIYRILRDEFNSKPPLTKEQFFTLGFAERKLQFVTSLVQLCRKKSDALKPKKKKTVLGSNAAKTSKMDIHIPGRTASATTGTKGVQGTSLVTMPTKTPLASHFPKPTFDNVVVSEQITRRQSLNDDLNVSMPGDASNGQNDVPRPSFQIPFVPKNVASSAAQSRLETLAGINTLSLQERPWDVASKNEHATKENICPNSGNDLTDDVYHNAHSLISRNVVGRLDPRQSMILSPIPVTNKMTITGLDSQSEKQIGTGDQRPSNMPFVNYSELPEFSKHIFVTQTSEGIERPSRNESLDMSLLDQHSQEVAEILGYVKEQDKRIDTLEKEVDERNSRIDELVETNYKLNARVMVLETAVALIQEKLEP